MGLFTKKKSYKFKEIPSTPEQDAARSYLTGLLYNKIQYPTLKIAPMTDSEKTVQDQVKSYLANAPADFDTAAGYFRDVINDQYDPATSMYYEGFRREADTAKSEAQAQVRRSAQKAGVARSTPSLGMEARTGMDYDSRTMQLLGSLLQDERNFKSQAAQVLPQMRGSQVSQLAVADQLASKPREIQQARYQAAYEKIVNDMLAPYLYNANIASAILNEPRYQGYTSGGGLTDWGNIATLGATVAAGWLAGRD